MADEVAEEEKTVECNQCGHEWTPRKAHPKQCPRCKRYDWNEEKKSY